MRQHLLRLGAAFVLLALLQGGRLDPVRPSGVSASRARLLAELGPIRPIEARLTAGLPYRPLDLKVQIEDGVVYGYDRPPALSRSQRQAVEISIPSSAWVKTGDPSATALWDAGFRILLLQDYAKRAKARALLEEASAEDPHNAHLMADLSALYLLGGAPLDGPVEILALDAALRSVQLDSELLEARFNLGLALERCKLFEQAREAWEGYLERDPSSGWSHEARRHLEYLQSPSPKARWLLRQRGRVAEGLSDIPFAFLSIAETETLRSLTDAWATSIVSSRYLEATQTLDAERRIASQLDQVGLFKTAVDAVRDIDDARTSEETTVIASGLLAYRKAEDSYQRGELSIAHRYFDSARHLLARRRSPFLYWAQARLAEVDCEIGRFDESHSLLRSLRSTADLDRYRGLSQQLHWAAGLCSFHRGQMRNAIRSLEGAMSPSDADSEVYIEAATLLARISGSMEMTRIDPIFSPLHRLENASPPRNRVLLLSTLAAAAERLRRPLATRAVWREVEILTARHGLAGDQLRCLAALGRFETSQGNPQAALSAIARIQRAVNGSADEFLQEQGRREATLALCALPAGLGASGCENEIATALAHFRHFDVSRLPQLIGLWGATTHRAGHIESGRLSIPVMLQSVSRPWSGLAIFSPAWKSDLFDQQQTLEIASGRADVALSQEEQARRHFKGSSWPSRFTWPASRSIGTEIAPVTLSDQTRHRNAFTAFVDYFVRGDRIGARVFRLGRLLASIDLPVTIQQLRASLPPMISTPRYTYHFPRVQSEALSRWLIAPIAPYLPREGRLVFLLDTTLESVDFMALTEPRFHRRLGKEYAITLILKPMGYKTHGGFGEIVRCCNVRTKPKSPPPHQSLREDSSASSFSLRAFLASMPAETTVLEYAFLGERVGIWVLNRQGLQFRYLDRSRDEVLREVRRFHLAIRHKRTLRVERTLAELGVLFLEPVRSLLPPGGKLIVVPEEALLQVPFAALPIETGGPRLLERYSTSVAPSLGMYSHHMNRERRHSEPWKVAVVSRFAEDEVQSPSLQGARVEASTIERLLPGSQTFSTLPAPEPFHNGPPFNILHFNGHSVADVDRGDSVPSPNASLWRKQLRLVVLASCSTGLTPAGLDTSHWWLPGLYLSAGIPAAIGSLWPVSDFATGRLMTDFYQALAKGVPADSALRAAQLGLLHSPEPWLRKLTAWAGFQIYGYGAVHGTSERFVPGYIAAPPSLSPRRRTGSAPPRRGSAPGGPSRRSPRPRGSRSPAGCSPRGSN